MSSTALPVVAADDQRPRRLTDVYRCQHRGRNLLLATCLDDYMNANALRVKSMVCFECTQGGCNREAFAADALAKEGIDCEVLDLRTIRPLDIGSVVRSVKKTSTCVVVDQSWSFGSPGSELAAQVQQHDATQRVHRQPR